MEIFPAKPLPVAVGVGAEHGESKGCQNQPAFKFLQLPASQKQRPDKEGNKENDSHRPCGVYSQQQGPAGQTQGDSRQKPQPAVELSVQRQAEEQEKQQNKTGIQRLGHDHGIVHELGGAYAPQEKGGSRGFQLKPTQAEDIDAQP